MEYYAHKSFLVSILYRTAAIQAVNKLAENYHKYVKGEINNFYHAQAVAAILELSSLKAANFQ